MSLDDCERLQLWTLRKFRQVFMEALRQVHAVYPAMKIDITGQGLFLYTSPPPVVKTGIVVKLAAKSGATTLPCLPAT
jgi:hypothetical protein